MSPEGKNNPVLIIGAGMTGLSSAFHLQLPYSLWEKEGEAGGLARTRKVRGFTFDYTGHWLHTRKNWTRQLITDTLGIELVEIKRRAAVYSHGVCTPYPFQAHTYGLPTQVIADCMLGYFTARERRISGEGPVVTTFADHIRDQLGDGIARHFMIPYNTKLWTVPPSEMSARWCKRFVPQPKPEEVVYGALRPEGANEPIGYNDTFWYPREGGIGTIPARMSTALRYEIEFDCELMGIDHKAKTARSADGQVQPFSAIISTMPLPQLVERLENPPQRIKQAASQLRSAAVTYWNIAFKGTDSEDAAHWTYFPESDYPFYRVGSPSAVRPSLAPLQHRSYWAEVSHRSGSSVNTNEQSILDGLQRSNICAPGEEPILMERRTIPIAYVIMDHHYEDNREEIIGWLREQGIYATGRFGGWTYNSMEDALVSGREAARWVEEYCANG